MNKNRLRAIDLFIMSLILVAIGMLFLTFTTIKQEFKNFESYKIQKEESSYDK